MAPQASSRNAPSDLRSFPCGAPSSAETGELRFNSIGDNTTGAVSYFIRAYLEGVSTPLQRAWLAVLNHVEICREPRRVFQQSTTGSPGELISLSQKWSRSFVELGCRGRPEAVRRGGEIDLQGTGCGRGHKPNRRPKHQQSLNRSSWRRECTLPLVRVGLRLLGVQSLQSAGGRLGRQSQAR